MGTPLFTGDVFQWACFCNVLNISKNIAVFVSRLTRDPTQRHFLAQIRGDNPGVLGSGDQVIGYPEFLRTKVTDASPIPEGIN